MDDILNPQFLILHERPKGVVEERWLRCLISSRYGGSYCAPDFFDDPYFRSRRPFAILIQQRDEIVAVLTGHHEGRHLRSGISVRPQLCCAEGVDLFTVSSALQKALAIEATSSDLIDLFTWNALPMGSAYRSREYEGVVMLDLAHGPDALFRKFSENKRINIKKAIKKGVTVDITTNERDIAAFYDITADWSRRKQLEIPDRARFFESFAMTNIRALFLARHAGEILAGAVMRFHDSGLMEYAANSSWESSLHLRPNDLLHWRAIEWACTRGLKYYSLGGSHLFLRKFHGPLVPTFRYRRDRSTFRQHLVLDLAGEAASAAVRLAPTPLLVHIKALRDKIWRRV